MSEPAPSYTPPGPEVLLAREQTSIPVGPVTYSDSETRRIRVEATAAEIDESYRTQVYESPLPALTRLVPAVVEGALSGPETPLRLFTAWNADGQRCRYDENWKPQRELRAALGDRFVGRCVAVPPRRQWFEEVLLAHAFDDDEALDLARQFGQPALITWADDTLRIDPTGRGAVVTPATLPASLVPRERACPLRIDQQRGALCHAHGGPWTGSSIHAAALWAHHRGVAVRALGGCLPCADGRVKIHGPMGRGISIAHMYLGSRYGGTSW